MAKRLPRGIKAHALVLAACVFLLLGANHVLDMFELVRSTRGPGGAMGAWYTDVHAQIPAQLVLTAAAILAAAPTVLVYLLLGRLFMRGLLAGALKG